MKRIPEDVAEYDPTWVVFHFGMNDVDRGAYSDKSASGLLRRRAAAYDNYCRNLDAVVRKVAEAAPRAKFIYLTPTIYDDTAIPTNMPPSATGWATVNQRGCSVALSMMAGHVLEKAARDDELGIDLYTPLQNYLMKRRANEPHFMLTRWDTLSPGSHLDDMSCRGTGAPLANGRRTNLRAASTSHCRTPCRNSRNPAPCLTRTSGTARRRGFSATTTVRDGHIPGAPTLTMLRRLRNGLRKKARMGILPSSSPDM